MDPCPDHAKPSPPPCASPTPYCRKVYHRATLLGLIASLAMTPDLAVAESGPASPPRYNVEIFAKPGTERVLGGIEAVVPFLRSPKAMPFLDLKGKIDDDDSHEINAALGFRGLTASGAWLLGGFLSRDWRSSEYDHEYRWFTAGVEALSRDYDFRANYYHTNDDPEIIRFGSSATFSGSSLLVANSVVEEPLSGGDLEVGMLLPVSTAVETRAFLGGYLFSSDLADDITGGRLRFEIRPRKNIIIGLEGSYDNARHEQLFAEIRFSFGYTSEPGIRTMAERMLEPVHRDIDGPMVTPDDITLPMQDPDTGEQTVYVHLDNANDSDPAQDGTQAHPYSSLANYYAASANRANTTLVVHQGDGTTTGYDQTLFLEDGQSVWGEGYGHGMTIAGFGGADKFPRMTTLAGQQQPGDPPVVIHLANNNEVAGVALQPTPLGIGILGGDYASFAFAAVDVSGPSGANGFQLHHNRFTGESAATGIAIATRNGGSSTGSITANQMDIGTPIVLLNNAIANGTSIQNVAINHNTLAGAGNGFSVSDQQFAGAIVLANSATGEGNSAVQNVTLGNNTLNSIDDGMFAINRAIHGGTTSQQLTVSNNTMVSSEGIGLRARNTGMESEDGFDAPPVADSGSGPTLASQRLTATGNTITAQGDAVIAENYGIATGTHTQDVTISNNTLVSEQGRGLVGANIAFGGYGAYGDSAAVGTTQARQQFTASDNAITSADDNLLLYNFAVNGTATQDAEIRNNTITSGYGGVVLYSYGSGILAQKAVITDNTMVTDDDGVVAINEQASTSTQTLEVTGNTITSGYHGITLQNYDTGSQDSTVTGNTITSAKVGVRLRNTGEGVQTSTVTGNTITSEADGLGISSDVSGLQQIAISANTIHGAVNGVAIEQSGAPDGKQEVKLLGNTIFGVTDGIYATNLEAGHQQLTITDNAVGSDSGQDAIHLDNQGEGIQETDISGNTTPQDQ